MQVQIQENWADIRAEVCNVGPSRVDGYVEAEIMVHEARPVPKEGPLKESWPNMLQSRVGQQIKLQVPRKLADLLQLKSGTQIAGRIRQAGVNLFYAHPERLSVVK
jgi:hypothetical protein